LGIGDWGLGIGPNPQSPIPNPQFTDYLKVKYFNKKLIGIKMLKYDRNSKEIFYKAKYYHDLNKECFYTIVYPYALFDKVLNVFYRKFGKFD
jgi:hypothetical protein